MRNAITILVVLSCLAAEARAQAESEPVAVQADSVEGFGLGIEISSSFFTALNGQFARYSGAVVGAAYLTPLGWLGVEAWSTLPGSVRYRPSQLVHDVYDYEQLTPGEVDLKLIDRMSFGGVRFSPIKDTAWTYGVPLTYRFDLNADLGAVRTLESCIPHYDGCGEERFGIGRGYRVPKSDRYHGAVALGAGARVLVARWLGLRVDLRNIRYSDSQEESGHVIRDKLSLYFLFVGAAGVF